MVQSIRIENFKSIRKLDLELGRINVFIGENGSGKSNILEAIALAGAATANKLDNEFLASRGIRATGPRHMRSALADRDPQADINIRSVSNNGKTMVLRLSHDNKPYSSWVAARAINHTPAENAHLLEEVRRFIDLLNAEKKHEGNDSSEGIPTENVLKLLGEATVPLGIANWTSELTDFLIYSPENSSLRLFEQEGQIEPLGIRGEGLLKYLQVLAADPAYAGTLVGIQDALGVLGWFNGLGIPSADANMRSRIEIGDRFLSADAGPLDQTSANEGFLFLLFYFSLFSTDLTPEFFAIDNVDASLNPKLCARLIVELNKLAKIHGKQAILTTHNPATLDGLDLNDDQQRLFVISRGPEGETRVRRIQQKSGSMAGIKLSTAFIDGFLGGLPENF